MLYLRRLTQLFFLGLFIYLIIRTVEPLTSFIPTDIFFTSNPLIALGTIIASREFIHDFLVSLFIIIVTILMGRVFCGWACPLGTTFDLLNLLIFKRFKRFDISLVGRSVKYIVLIALIIAAVFGVNAIGWFDPISLAFKGYALLLYPALSWAGKATFSNQFITPLINLGILDRNNLLFHGTVILGIVILVILLLNIIEQRFWCRNLCPLGALLGLLSKWRLLRTNIGTDCNECHQCVKECKMGALTKELTSLDEECIYCYSCTEACKPQQLSITMRKDKQKTISILPSRRGFLAGALLGIAAVPLLKHSLLTKEYNIILPRLRPPGADRTDEKFLEKCIRCGECMKVCPNNALHPLITEGGIYGLFSPILIPRAGFCSYECNLCGQTCPTGAIMNLDLDAKKQWKIGMASVDYNKCIHCLTCEEHCPVPNKAIKVIEIDGLQSPQVINELCIGCGICENVCPIDAPAAIRVFTINY